MIAYDFHKLRSPRDKRLATEHLNVENVCSKSSRINYDVIGVWNARKPPEAYRITYNVKSIIGVKPNQEPVYRHKHVVEIHLPQGYPRTATARCAMQTEIWHPNIKSKGQFKGRICSNSKNFGKLYQLDDLILRIGEIIQYKNYHAVNTFPFPEDEDVARWVREIAEPKGWVSKIKAVDNSPLLGDSPPVNDHDAPHSLITPESSVTEEDSPKIESSGIKIRPKRISIRPR